MILHRSGYGRPIWVWPQALALILWAGACADSAGPRLRERRKVGQGPAATGLGAAAGERERPGTRMGQSEAPAGPVSVGEAAGVAQVEVLASGAPGEEGAAPDRKKEESERAEIARLQAEIERRQREEAEAKLKARRRQAREAEEQASRSGEAQRQREETQQVLSELGGEGEDLAMLEKRIEAKRGFLGRYRTAGSAAGKGSQIPTTMHELADLEIRYANEKFLRVMNEFDRNEAICKAGKPGCKADVPLPLKDFSKAVELYEALLKDYPDRRDNDKVLYQLSFAYQEMGEPGRAETVLTDFLKDHGKDPRSQAAWFRLGLSYSERTVGMDIFDSQPWLRKAIEAYQNAIEFKDDTYYYDQSLFQLGWSSFRLTQYADCVKWMDRLERKIIANAKKKNEYKSFENLYDQSHGLVREAIKFMAIAWSEMGDGKSGPANLENFWAGAPKGDFEQYTYIAMGEFFEKEERYAEAIDIYQRMIKKYPTYVAIPRVLELIVTVYEKDKKWEQVNAARKDIVERLAPGGRWWKASAPDACDASVPIRSRATFQLAQYHHSKAQFLEKEQKDPREINGHYEESVRYYQLFLTDYPKADDAPEALYLLAEVFFSLEKWPEAAMDYEQVAWVQKNEKRKDTSAYKSVVAWGNALIQDLAAIEGKKKAAGRPYDRAIGLTESRFTAKVIGSIDRFLHAYPDHKDAADLINNEGEILYSTHQYEKAREVFRLQVARFPKDPRSLEAQRNIATTYLDAGDQVSAEKEYRTALAMTPVTDAKNREELRTLIAGAIYKQGEQKKKDGDLTGAAELFLKVPQDPDLKDVEIAPTAYFDGAIAYRDANKWDLAVPAFEGVARQYPKSDFAAKSMAFVGTHYRDEKKLPQAAKAFLAASALFEAQGDQEKAEDFFYVSGKMYEEMEDWDKVLQTMREYTRKFGAKPKRIVEAKFIEGYASYTRKKYDEALRIWKDLYVLHERLAKKDPELTAQFPARAKFLTAELSLADYEPAAISGATKSSLKSSLKRKQDLLTQVIKLYGDAAQYKVEEYTTASVFRIGMAMINFRDAIIKSERPKAVLKDPLLNEEYGYALEEQAFPFEEKAIQTFQQNLSYSRKNQVFNDWIEKSYAQLAAIVPGRYARPDIAETLSCNARSFAGFAPKPKPAAPPAAPGAPGAKPAQGGTPAPPAAAAPGAGAAEGAAPKASPASTPEAAKAVPQGEAAPAPGKAKKAGAVRPAAKKRGKAKKQ